VLPFPLRNGWPSQAALATWVGLLALMLLPGCPTYGPGGEKDACVTCHEGIEQAHPEIPAERCSLCHGGDPTRLNKELAHVPIPEDWADIRGPGLPPSPPGFIRDFAPDQLDAIDPAYLQFINPGDMRVLEETCAKCHPEHAANMPNSVMNTNAGHYWPTLFLAGLQDEREGHYGAFAATDPDCDLSIPGTVCELETLTPPGEEEMAELFADGVPDDEALLEMTYRHYLSKNCGKCHQSGFSRNDSPGLYRSTGCSSCHVVYDQIGNYQGNDPTIARGSPVHPKEHKITAAVPTQQCVSCHYQGGRIGLLFQGIREGGFSGDETPPFATPVPGTMFGHAPGYYFSDEDSTNNVDETPGDLHHQAGMVCADCHVGVDVHGDGRIYSSSKHQVTIACEDCHGTVREPASPDSAGVFRKDGGGALRQLSYDNFGNVILTGIMDGTEWIVPQPAEMLAPGGLATDLMRAAMEPDGDDWSHPDSLTCDTCHTNHNQICIGCHVSLDLRLNQVDTQTGLPSPGLTRGSRSLYTLDHVLLGTGTDGRVQSVVPSQQVQIAVVGAEEYGVEDGALLHGGVVDDGEGGTKVVGQFRQARGRLANNGFAPIYQHTASRSPRSCSTCHPADDSPEEMTRVRGVYGFGTGEFMLPAHDGSWVDGLQFLGADGSQSTDWVHPGTGPVSEERRTRAMDVILGELE